MDLVALSLSTSDTAVWETPAARATSSWVGRLRVFGASIAITGWVATY
jgi:hypothetical protein